MRARYQEFTLLEDFKKYNLQKICINVTKSHLCILIETAEE